MKFLTTIMAAAICFISALAIQSKPFLLVIESSSSALNGRALEAGHEGAALEAPIKGRPVAEAKAPHLVPYYTYYFNYTHDQPNYGTLVFNLPVGKNMSYSSGMVLLADPSTNVGLPLFGYGDFYNGVSFDQFEEMYIGTHSNDQKSPPTIYGPRRRLYRWYICETAYAAYIYHTLSWVYGPYIPENPSCEKVKVKRVFL